MPDRGDERGRGGTRTLVTGILAGTEWHPATNPREATQTAREARDLAVRLRPVLSKLAQAPRGGRRRDLDWLPAVEQLAVDAQYFASWWLPRLEGKSAGSWPSWSADGYADWVKRLDAQRLRTLEMVEGTAPVTRIASVTQLRRGKGTAAEPEAVEQAPAPDVEEPAEPHSPGRHARGDAKAAEAQEEERTARITPLRGPGAALMDAALMDVSGASDAPGMRADESELDLSADETQISMATTPLSSEPDVEGIAGSKDSDSNAKPTVPTTPPIVAATTAADPDLAPDLHSTADALPPVPRTPPNQGPVDDDLDATHIRRPAENSGSLGFNDIAADAAASAASPTDAGLPRVPRTPPNQGPADDDAGIGADILQIPRTPPNTGPAEADRPRKPRSPIVSLVGLGDGIGDGDRPRVPRTPPNPGPAGDGLAAGLDADSTHVSLAPSGPAALNAGPAGRDSGAGSALGTGKGTKAESDERTRPLFRSEASAPAAAALTGAAAAAGASGTQGGASSSVGAGMYGPSHDDEFEHFQPGDDLPPPIFPMTEPTEPVDRGRIVRYALAAVLLAAGGVLVFVAVTQKGSANKTAATPPSSSSSSTAAPSTSEAPSSSIGGAVTPPTATDTTPAAPPPASKPVAAPPKPNPPTSSASKNPAAPSHTSAAPPPPQPPPTSHQQPPPVSGGVSSLSVSSLSPDQTGSFNYTAHLHVTPNWTGTVTVTVTFAGSQSGNSPGSTGAQSQTFTLSGRTSYDLSPQTDVHGMCPSSYIDAVASASGAGSSVAYASSPC